MHTQWPNNSYHNLSEYPGGVPILSAVRPMGGDYTQDVFVAIEGVAVPYGNYSSEYASWTCQLAFKNEEQRLNAMGDGLSSINVLPQTEYCQLIYKICCCQKNLTV